jgi:hypothetical protein
MLKAALAVAVLLLLATGKASAGTLLTGAIRDRSGAPVAGARVTGFDAAGRAVGVDRSAPDGTFALDASAQPAAIGIACDFCAPVRRAVEAGEPVVIIIERYAAVAAEGPSAEDLRALPLRSADGAASLLPFTLGGNGDGSAGIANRGLAPYGAVAIDGLPFYDAADGSTAAPLVPAHAVAALTAISPLEAAVDGGYASAGTYDFELHDPDLPTSRFDLGAASDAIGRFGGSEWEAGYAASGDPGDNRQAADATANFALAGGRFAATALDTDGDGQRAAGAGLAYARSAGRFPVSAALSATQTGDSSLVTFAAQTGSRDPAGLQIGVRAIRATGTSAGIAAAQYDAAAWAAAIRPTALGRLGATLAWDHGSDAGIGGGSAGSALVGSIADDLRLDAHWSTHLGTVSDLRIPTFAEVAAFAPAWVAVDRSVLFENSVTYSDLRRLRIGVESYAQRTTGPAAGTVNGLGIDAAWQLAPAFAVRSWLLAANQTPAPSAGPYVTSISPLPDAGSPYAVFALTPDASRPAATPGRAASSQRYPPAAATSHRAPSLIWLTYEKWVRVDVLDRGGAIEGDVRIPLGKLYAFTLGTTRYDGRRITTFGVTLR